MRKFPIYSLLQELTMQGMMILLIIGYIAYDFQEIWKFYSYVTMAICGVGIILLFRNQMTAMKVAKVISVVSDKHDFKIKRNWVFNSLMNLLVLGLTLLHFYLYQRAGKDFSPLYSEYGIGVLLGAGIWIFDFLKSEVIITDQGVVNGSKLRPSLITWSEVANSKTDKGTVTIQPKNTFGVKEIQVRGIRARQQLSTLLRMHNKMK